METSFTYYNKDGVRRTLTVDAEKPFTPVVCTEVQMDAILEGIKADRELHPERSTNKLLARVPITVMERAMHEQWGDDEWRQWLNDPDNAAFRIWKGRV